MDNEKDKNIVSSIGATDFFSEGDEVKIVWKEDEKTKVGRGKIMGEDVNFIYLTGDRGKVIGSKTDVIAVKQGRDSQ